MVVVEVVVVMFHHCIATVEVVVVVVDVDVSSLHCYCFIRHDICWAKT